MFTLAKFRAISPVELQPPFLPWPPWAAQHKIGLFLFFVVLPKVAKARTNPVAVTDIFA